MICPLSFLNHTVDGLFFIYRWLFSNYKPPFTRFVIFSHVFHHGFPTFIFCPYLAHLSSHVFPRSLPMIFPMVFSMGKRSMKIRWPMSPSCHWHPGLCTRNHHSLVATVRFFGEWVQGDDGSCGNSRISEIVSTNMHINIYVALILFQSSD